MFDRHLSFGAHICLLSMHRHVKQVQVVCDLKLFGKQTQDGRLALGPPSKSVETNLQLAGQLLEKRVSEVITLLQEQRPQLHFGTAVAVLTNSNISKEPPIANLDESNGTCEQRRDSAKNTPNVGSLPPT